MQWGYGTQTLEESLIRACQISSGTGTTPTAGPGERIGAEDVCDDRKVMMEEGNRSNVLKFGMFISQLIVMFLQRNVLPTSVELEEHTMSTPCLHHVHSSTHPPAASTRLRIPRHPIPDRSTSHNTAVDLELPNHQTGLDTPVPRSNASGPPRAG